MIRASARSLRELTTRPGLSRLTTARPRSFGGVNLSAISLVPVAAGRLVFASRIMADVGLGAVPLHMLSQHGGLEAATATGGGSSIRGVWADRRNGRVKLLSNLEVRVRPPSFHVLGVPLTLGPVLFADAGRVWTDLQPHPDLDGTGPGLATGVGGGLRLRIGEDILLRLDAAWSPSEGTDGVYLDFGHAF